MRVKQETRTHTPSSRTSRNVHRSDVPAQTSSSLFLSLYTSSSLARTTVLGLASPASLPLLRASLPSSLFAPSSPAIVPLSTRLPASGGPQPYSVVHFRHLYLFGEAYPAYKSGSSVENSWTVSVGFSDRHDSHVIQPRSHSIQIAS